MKVIAIQASPNQDGLTSRLAQAVLKGAGNNGAETELIHLNELNLKSCTACNNGWGKCKEDGTCILEDGFQKLNDKIAKCDALVFATPVYWHDLSESAKTFLDRLRRCETGVDFRTFTGKKTIGIASAGGVKGRRRIALALALLLISAMLFAACGGGGSGSGGAGGTAGSGGASLD